VSEYNDRNSKTIPIRFNQSFRLFQAVIRHPEGLSEVVLLPQHNTAWWGFMNLPCKTSANSDPLRVLVEVKSFFLKSPWWTPCFYGIPALGSKTIPVSIPTRPHNPDEPTPDKTSGRPLPPLTPWVSKKNATGTCAAAPGWFYLRPKVLFPDQCKDCATLAPCSLQSPLAGSPATSRSSFSVKEPCVFTMPRRPGVLRKPVSDAH